MTDRLKVQNRFLIPSTYVNSNTPGMALAPLAVRAGHLNAKGVRFPISASEDTYLHGPNAGRTAIKLLSKADQQTVRDLKPWKGGNGLLYALHQLVV